jgi:hypothetical protein
VTYYKVLENGAVFYMNNEGDACYYEDDSMTLLCDNIADAVVSPDESYVYCTGRGDGSAEGGILYRCRLKDGADAEELADDAVVTGMDGDICYYKVRSKGMSMDFYDLYYAQSSRDPVLVSEKVCDVYSHCKRQEGLYYTTDKEDTVSLWWYSDKEGKKLVNEDVKDLKIDRSLAWYTDADGEQKYSCAGGEEKSFEDVKKVKDARISADRRYALLSVENVDGTEQIISYRASEREQEDA